MGHNKPM